MKSHALARAGLCLGWLFVYTAAASSTEATLTPAAVPYGKPAQVTISVREGAGASVELLPGGAYLKAMLPSPSAGSVAARGQVRAGNRLYEAKGAAGLVISTVTDNQSVIPLAHYPTQGPAHDVSVSDGRAYVAQGEHGLLILDVMDPAQPLWVGSHSKVGDARYVVARGDSAWVANTRGDVIRIDVSNAAQPSTESVYATGREITALAVEGRDILAATPQGILRIAFDADAPQYTNAGLDAGRGVNFGGQRRADVVGDLVYVADWFSGMHIYDVSNAERPRLLASLHTPGSSKGVAVRDGYAYVADDDHGLQVVDVHDARAPRLVASLATPGLAYTPKLAGNLLYLASHRGGFQIIDVAQPTAPKIIADVPTAGMAWSLAIAEDRLYVADDAAGLLIYDVHEPAQPELIGSYDADGRLEEVLVRDGVAYLAYFDQGIKTVDVHTPAQSRVLAEFTTPGNARGLDLQGHDLYVADWLAGVHIVDVTDPAQPKVTRSYDTPGAAWGVRARGDRAYVLDWWGGFAVLLSAPDRLVRYAERGTVHQIAAQGDYLYAAQGEGGLQIFDAKNSLNPTWITGVELPGKATGVTLTDGVARVEMETGVARVDIRNPFEARLLDTQVRALATPATPLPALALDLGAELRDLVRVDDTLYAVTAAGVAAIDAHDPARPTITARYPLAVNTGRATLHRGVLYLAGESTLTALRPLPRLRATLDAQGQGLISLPATLPLGAYDVLIGGQVQHNAFKVEMPRLGAKPKFSMEDLKKAMEAMKRAQEQQIKP